MQSIIQAELWKVIDWIDGLPHIYAVSTLGRIKRMACERVNSKGFVRRHRERFLSPTDNGNGYKIISFTIRKKRKNFYMHRLVAQAFLENPEGKLKINHKDYDRGNNNVNNLEWCTDRENTIYSAWKNRHPRSKVAASEYGRGIRKKDNRYEVAIYHAGKQIYVGRFRDIDSAVRARNQAYTEKGLGAWVSQL